ncbi:MAG: WbqC family protein [Bacteroidales bacterium]|nr:WbqC family protein [Bacteroidales bacterium]
MAAAPVVALEACEHYGKQSWRNRCRILTAGGPMDLRVPVCHGGSRLITEVRIDYATPWVRQTEYAIETAYDSSPFFAYYRDPLFALLEAKPERLWELNLSLIRFFCEKIGLEVRVEPTKAFVPPGADVPDDWRERLHPKRPCLVPAKPYWQVFRERFGFVPGLSVLDLLCNEGPESVCIIK